MSDATKSQITLRGVTRVYRTNSHQVQAVAGVDLTMHQGEFVCLAGPSGSGKSTLLHLIGTLDQPSSGTIHFGGRDISGLSRSASALFRRTAVGFVFQTFNLIPVLTAFENVEYVLLLQGIGAAERNKRVTMMLDAVGLAELAQRRITDLSGGQQQRVAVARALIGNPSLVLADEPTGNLDSATGESIIALLRRLNEERGTTVLYSSHDPRIIAWADRLILLQDGKIFEDHRQTKVE
ncbi:MAG: macrolide ABC transporter ATP-binding protein [Deltaproteobacteria bacterium RIFOXYD12_FULL_56_24]|nr:MAG: macrolide ABC transporter ATP-binding protein [Deltaproteobacteria bacterium RIFOXYD12_FULL_56_24]